MQNANNNSVLLLLVGGIVVTAAAMMTAIFIAGQRPVVVVVPTSTAPAAAPVDDGFPPAPVQAVAQRGGDAEPRATAAPAAPAAKPPSVTVARVSSVPANGDLFNGAWDRAPAAELPLQPQQTAAPMLDQTTISHVTVQALRDDQRIAFRLRWPQAEPAESVDVGRQSDAIAIQLPLVDNAPFTMGAPNMPVRILQWRALWQRDIDHGFQDVHTLYPNFWSDLYWFAGNDWPRAMREAFADERSHQWLVAYSAGNPMADFKREQPVEELAAEGFGTTTHVPDSPSTARGVWQDGYWTVVIDRPLNRDEPLGQRLLDGSARHGIALAVWDGAAGNAGGRKHYCNWVPMTIEP